MSHAWQYFTGNQPQVLSWLGTTVWLALIPLAIALALSLPMGWVASRYRWSYPPIVTFGGLLYTIPSIVLFLVLPGILGTRILDPLNVAVALTVYCVALLVRVVADGLRAVDPDILNAASAMGYADFQRLLVVQLPLAIPVIGAGLRVAAVSNVSLIAVASTLGVSQLGSLFTIGNTTGDTALIWLGLVMFVLLALVLDGLIVLSIRLATPWRKVAGIVMISSARGSGLPSIGLVPRWLFTASHWTGQHGLLVSLREHVVYTVIAVVAAMVVAIPVGLVIGHTDRGSFAVVGAANAIRAVPAFGLMILLYVIVSPKIHYGHAIGWLVPRGGLGSLVPVEAVLVVLAIPPILTNTYAGVRGLDPAVRDAARGMGMSAWQIVLRVEAPIALPLILAGIRSAVLQVIATATIAGYLPFLGGLGYLIFINGLPQINDPNVGYPAMLGAALLVAALAGITDVLLLGLEQLLVSPGLSRRATLRSRGASRD